MYGGGLVTGDNAHSEQEVGARELRSASARELEAFPQAPVAPIPLVAAGR